MYIYKTTTEYIKIYVIEIACQLALYKTGPEKGKHNTILNNGFYKIWWNFDKASN
jgi:hypothetical protein